VAAAQQLGVAAAARRWRMAAAWATAASASINQRGVYAIESWPSIMALAISWQSAASASIRRRGVAKYYQSALWRRYQPETAHQQLAMCVAAGVAAENIESSVAQYLVAMAIARLAAQHRKQSAAQWPSISIRGGGWLILAIS